MQGHEVRLTVDLDSTRNPVETADQLAALERVADAVIEAGTRHNTQAAFDQDRAHWVRHCADLGLPPNTVDENLLVSFVAWLARGGPDHPPQAPASIRRRLTGVLSYWKRRKLTVPYGVTSKARSSLTILERNLAEANECRGRGASPALTIPNLRRMCEAMPDTRVGHRDRLVILLGFGIAARRSELANLLISDVTPDPEGLVVRVRTGKTPREVAVKPGTHPGTDPVRAWRTWLHAAEITDGPALRPIHWSGSVQPRPLAPASIGAIVTQAGERVGVYGLTGHSLRSGLATEARRAGHDRKTIAAQTGHSPKSAILDGYMQIVDRWADNALTGIGL